MFFVKCEKLINDETYPREVVNGPLRVTDERIQTDFGCARGRITVTISQFVVLNHNG